MNHPIALLPFFFLFLSVLNPSKAQSPDDITFWVDISPSFSKGGLPGYYIDLKGDTIEGTIEHAGLNGFRIKIPGDKKQNRGGEFTYANNRFIGFGFKGWQNWFHFRSPQSIGQNGNKMYWVTDAGNVKAYSRGIYNAQCGCFRTFRVLYQVGDGPIVKFANTKGGMKKQYAEILKGCAEITRRIESKSFDVVYPHQLVRVYGEMMRDNECD